MAQSSYVPQEYCTTVRGMTEEAQTEIARLAEECAYAGAQFPNPEHPKAVAFQKVAERLRLVVLDPEAVPDDICHKVVIYFGQRPRRMAHKMARWCRAANLATGLRSAARLIPESGDGFVSIKEVLAGTATYLENTHFPVLYDPKGEEDQ